MTRIAVGLILVIGGCSTSRTATGKLPDATMSADANPPDSSIPDGSSGDSARTVESGTPDASTVDADASVGPCIADEQCAPGLCRGGECVARCTADSECGPERVCDLMTGECRRNDPRPGGPCETDADCPGEAQCFSEEGTGIPGGFCVRPCETDDECSSGTLCRIGRCWRTCVTDAACSPGRVCGSILSEDPGFVCFPVCTSDSDCSVQGYRCDRATSLCRPQT